MYYEEKFENGIWYCRGTPDGVWSVKSIQMSKANEEALNWINAQIESARSLGVHYFRVFETIRTALTAKQPDVNDELLDALKRIVENGNATEMSIIAQKAISRAEQKGGV